MAEPVGRVLNLGVKQRRIRLIAGLSMAMVAVILAVWSVVGGYSPWLRLMVGLPTWIAILNVFQVRQST